LNAIGAFLYTFGTIDGHPITAAFLAVGWLLLLPSIFLEQSVGHMFGRLFMSDTLASFLTACVVVAANAAIWNIVAMLVSSRRASTVK
jgi:hypothetical protein